MTALLSNSPLAAGFDGFAFIAFIIFMILGYLSDYISKQKKAAQSQGSKRPKAPKMRAKKSPRSPKNETAEQFFARLEAQKRQEMGEELVENNNDLSEPLADSLVDFPSFEQKIKPEEPVKQKSQVGETSNNKKKSVNYIDRKDLKAFRRAIIINEILNKPKAYEI